MANYTWNNDLVPSTIKVKQVYGIAFTNDFRILLRIEDNKYKLTGGKPEVNEDYEQTLKREYIEELNVELEDCYYLGYLLVEENNESYAQVRMIAKIKSINDKHIDPANGKIYDRKLVLPDRVKKYLNYQDKAGNIMLDEGINLAKNTYEFNENSLKEELI